MITSQFYKDIVGCNLPRTILPLGLSVTTLHGFCLLDEHFNGNTPDNEDNEDDHLFEAHFSWNWLGIPDAVTRIELNRNILITAENITCRADIRRLAS